MDMDGYCRGVSEQPADAAANHSPLRRSFADGYA